ncbi:MAG: hypothetical protein IIY21_01235 [Clostridiales bacterium]|nr:hypothetical protein [Clostridiales bacterium]
MSIDELIEYLQKLKEQIGGECTVIFDCGGGTCDINAIYIEHDAYDDSPYVAITGY